MYEWVNCLAQHNSNNGCLCIAGAVGYCTGRYIDNVVVTRTYFQGHPGERMVITRLYTSVATLYTSVVIYHQSLLPLVTDDRKDFLVN